jgi:hypothetical protein
MGEVLHSVPGSNGPVKAGKLFHNTREDKDISLKRGQNNYQRDFTVALDAPLGEQMLAVSVWRGVAGDRGKQQATIKTS